jgi:hypothetical protein
VAGDGEVVKSQLRGRLRRGGTSALSCVQSVALLRHCYLLPARERYQTEAGGCTRISRLVAIFFFVSNPDSSDLK